MRSRDLTSSCIPRCIKDDEGFKFFNTDGLELFGEEELAPPEPVSQDSEEVVTVAEVPTSPHVATISSESYISLDKVDFSTIVEEDVSDISEESAESTETNNTCVGSKSILILINAEKNLMEEKKCASPGNRTRVARMGILHDTTTPATQLVLGLETPCACNS